MLPAAYVSANALGRADAYRLGYPIVCVHPREVALLQIASALVIDFNYVLFDDQETAVLIANKHARRGVLVGLHTYYPQALEVYPLASLPNLLVAKTHRELLVQMGRYARRHGRPWLLDAEAAEPLQSEVKHVPDNDEEALTGAASDAPAV